MLCVLLILRQALSNETLVAGVDTARRTQRAKFVGLPTGLQTSLSIAEADELLQGREPEEPGNDRPVAPAAPVERPLQVHRVGEAKDRLAGRDGMARGVARGRSVEPVPPRELEALRSPTPRTHRTLMSLRTANRY